MHGWLRWWAHRQGGPEARACEVGKAGSPRGCLPCCARAEAGGWAGGIRGAVAPGWWVLGGGPNVGSRLPADGRGVGSERPLSTLSGPSRGWVCCRKAVAQHERRPWAAQPAKSRHLMDGLSISVGGLLLRWRSEDTEQLLSQFCGCLSLKRRAGTGDARYRLYRPTDGVALPLLASRLKLAVQLQGNRRRLASGEVAGRWKSSAPMRMAGRCHTRSLHSSTRLARRLSITRYCAAFVSLRSWFRECALTFRTPAYTPS